MPQQIPVTIQLRRPRISSRAESKRSKQAPTLTNVHISCTYDALAVMNAVRLGFLNMVKRRLDNQERDDIQSGHVYVYEETHGSKLRQGIERWTDGKRWSASRSKENFLFYEENSAGSEDPDADEASPRDGNEEYSNSLLTDYLTASDAPGRLTKMTFSSWVKLPTDPPDTKRKWLLVCYWQKPQVKTLPKAYELEELLELDIPENMFFSSRAGKNKQQGLPAAGTAYESVLRKPTDLDALRWRKKQYYATGGKAPMPVGPGTRPEDDPAFYAARTFVEEPAPVLTPASVTDARFRFHDQHQRTFPHHRTRRDEIEDIPITERPPHWRPQPHPNAVSANTSTSKFHVRRPSPVDQQLQHQQSQQTSRPALADRNAPVSQPTWPTSVTVGVPRPMLGPQVSSARMEPPIHPRERERDTSSSASPMSPESDNGRHSMREYASPPGGYYTDQAVSHESATPKSPVRLEYEQRFSEPRQLMMTTRQLPPPATIFSGRGQYDTVFIGQLNRSFARD